VIDGSGGLPLLQLEAKLFCYGIDAKESIDPFLAGSECLEGEQSRAQGQGILFAGICIWILRFG
jgi:hypothetical protein